MINALIDIGSNTIRLVVYEGFKEIENYAEYAGLIADVSNGEISPVGIGKIITALLSMRKRAETLCASNIYAFATASLRDIEDKESLVSCIKAATGIEVEMISGEAEAYYDYLGLKKVDNIQDGAAFDLGGGSCQIMVFRNDNVEGAVSLPLGGLKLHTEFVKGNIPSSDEREQLAEYVKSKVLSFKPFINCGFSRLCAMGGSVFALDSLAKVYFGDDCRLDGEVLKKLCTLTEEQICNVVPKRLKTVVPAAIVMLELLETSGAEEIVITTAGVRDGILFSKFSD